MTYDSLSLSELIPAPPERIYAAWLSSDEHTAFTGDKALVEPFVGGTHSAFDGYAVGRTVDLQPGRRIVQTWRAEDFPVGSPDSRVEVTLEETVGGTMVTILHTEIPRGQGSSCRDGWLKYYLEPLKGYFVGAGAASDHKPGSKSNGVRKHPPAVKVKAPVAAIAKGANAKSANAKTAKTKFAKPTARAKTAKAKAKAKANTKALSKAKASRGKASGGSKAKGRTAKAAASARTTRAPRKTAARTVKKPAAKARGKRPAKRK